MNKKPSKEIFTHTMRWSSIANCHAQSNVKTIALRNLTRIITKQFIIRSRLQENIHLKAMLDIYNKCMDLETLPR